MKFETPLQTWHLRRKTSALASAAIFAIAMTCGSSSLHAQTTWNGAGGDSNWFNGGNWVGGVAPNGITADVDVGSFPVDVNGSVNINSLNVGAGGVVNVLDNRTFDFGGTATTTITNAGAINTGNNTDFQLSQTVNNSGSITATYTGGSVFSDLEVTASGATLNGGGTVTLSGGNARLTGLTGAVLTVADQTINGGGQLGANSVGIINTSGGIIDATNAGLQLTVDASADGVDNDGLMRASGGATLGIAATNVDNTNGTIEATAGSTVRLQNSTQITGGSITGAGSVVIDGNSNVGFTDLDHSATTNVGNNTDLEVTGTINNSGSIDVNYTGGSVFTEMEVQVAGATLDGGGTVTLNGGNARVTGLTGAVLNIADQTINGGGQLGANSLGINNSAAGLIDATDAGQQMTVDASGLGLTNDGLMRASGGATLGIAATNVDNINGTIEATAGSTVRLQNSTQITGGSITGAGSVEIDGNSNVGFTDLDHSATTNVGNNTDLEITGSINNSGSIDVNYTGGSVFTEMEVQAAGATLDGGGTVTLNGGNARVTGLTGAVLNIADQTIDGGGQLGANSLGINNQATIDANQSGQTMTVDADGSGMVNSGVMRASGGGTMRIVGTNLNNVGGNIESAAGSEVRLGTNANIQGGTIGGPGSIFAEGNSNVFLEDISVDGNITTGNNIDLGLTGTIDNSADIQLNYTGGSVFSDIELQTGDVTLTGGGTVTLNGGNARIMGASGSKLVNESNTIRGYGQLGANSIDIENLVHGTIDANVAGQTMTIDPVGVNNSTLTTFINDGTLRASNGGNLDVLHAVENNGTINTTVGSTFEARSLNNTVGSLLSGDGVVDVEVGTIFVSGDIAPGNSAGTLTLLDDTLFSSTAVLQTELESDSLFDILEVDGDLALAGILEVSLLSGFNPLDSDVFSIVSLTDPGAMITGEFANAANGSTLLTTDGTGSFTVTYSSSNVTLSNFSLTAVPEPNSAICLIGLAVGLLARRKRAI